MAATQELTGTQLHALIDILSHREVYAEIEDFRFPGALSTYGPPFQASKDRPSTSPALQALVTRFICNLPGLQDVSQAFWQQQIYAIIEDFEKAELSESYDKGHLGIRKTLATAISALIEYPVRGVFAGFDEPEAGVKDRKYDTTKAKDLQQAFKDLMQQTVYGDLLDDMFAKTAETDKLADHHPLVQAAHEFGLVNLASFMHYTLVISPKGQYLLTLIDHANKLIPYTLIRQTLKIGNVASMINAMVRVILAKMSVTSVTNWIGLTQSEDEGMNLLQNIISTVLHWDIRDLKSRSSKIEKSKDSPSKEQLQSINAYLAQTRIEHEAIRERSEQQSKSIIQIILSNAHTQTTLTKPQHTLALEYLAIHLSIRDREQIIGVLCHTTPDHITQSIRSLVSAYEPMIRSVHNAVDLSDTLYDFEIFLRDMIKLGRLDQHGKSAATPPSVGDFVQLLKKHQGSTHKFLHQCAKNGKDVTGWFHEYAKQAASHFRRRQHPLPSSTDAVVPQIGKNAGDLTRPLHELYTSLSGPQRTPIPSILDDHAAYLSKLHAASAARLHAVVTSPPSNNPALLSTDTAIGPSSKPASRAASPAPMTTSRSSSLRRGMHIPNLNHSSEKKSAAEDRKGRSGPGPGAYLARWQDLLDCTVITPAEAEGGKVRGGRSGSVVRASGAGTDAGLDEGDKRAAEARGPEVVGGGGGAGSGENNEGSEGVEHDDDDDDPAAGLQEARRELHGLGLSGNEDDISPPDVGPVVEALLPGFRRLLAERS